MSHKAVTKCCNSSSSARISRGHRKTKRQAHIDHIHGHCCFQQLLGGKKKNKKEAHLSRMPSIEIKAARRGVCLNCLFGITCVYRCYRYLVYYQPLVVVVCVCGYTLIWHQLLNLAVSITLTLFAVNDSAGDSATAEGEIHVFYIYAHARRWSLPV